MNSAAAPPLAEATFCVAGANDLPTNLSDTVASSSDPSQCEAALPHGK